MSLQQYLIHTSTATLILFSTQLYASPLQTNTAALNTMAQEFKTKSKIEKQKAVDFARQHNIPVREEFKGGSIIEIQKIENGFPRYYTTYNENAAKSTRANTVWTAPFNITGAGYDKLGEWDGGAVRKTHQELNGRITQIDGATNYSDHSTHVAGTLIASGVISSAKGMAPDATIKAYEWTDDDAEMATAASNGMEISNHSYGFITGWRYHSSYGWIWYGDTTIAQNEDYTFGFYDSNAKIWDEIAYNAPNYLIVKSAGNDRNDVGTTSNHYHSNGYIYSDNHYPDGYDQGGYDTISGRGNAKNLLTVGAVEDVLNYTSPSDVVMSYFSGWGPTDDGRIKPDIVGNGVNLYSSLASSDSAYGSYSGTSMAAPNVAGTLVLMQQYYQQTHNNTPMRSATLKALALHTADEAGDYTGPDYQFGWGLLNAEKAAELIKKDSEDDSYIQELTLVNNASLEKKITLSGTNLKALKVTIVWTDPAGTPVAPALDPSDKMLVNDLDLKITKDVTTYYPWKLDKDNPTSAATQNSTNDIDNVEQVYIENPTEGTYTVTISHKGSLTANQPFSMILSTGMFKPCPNDQYYTQGANICIDKPLTIPQDPPYLSPYLGYIQGSDEIDPNAIEDDTFNFSLPLCKHIQGEYICR